jgi:hypothetical protein
VLRDRRCLWSYLAKVYPYYSRDIHKALGLKLPISPEPHLDFEYYEQHDRKSDSKYQLTLYWKTL